MPGSVRRQVIDYFELRFQGKLFNERQILKELNPVLRREVVWYNTAELIHSVPMFEDVSDDFVYEIGSKLHYAVYLKRQVRQ